MTATDTSPPRGAEEHADSTRAAEPASATEAPDALERGRSASQILDSRQRQVLGTLCLFLVIFLLVAPLATVVAVMATATGVYLAVVTQRLIITKRSLDDDRMLWVPDEVARAIPEQDLPIYTVLVPAYHEAPVIEALATHLRALEYPRDRLDVKLLLEDDDLETIDAARHAAPDVQIVLIPPGGPRTKPKALNAGLQCAYGEFVTIYDAEDVPDPLQLRRAVAAFRRLPDDVACLQAQLTFHNWNHNIITRWFTIEYLMWFTLFLPGLSSMDAPIPLGGTSNHIRRDALEAVGAWDAYNVTEDADLGIRLYTRGWRVAVLKSETLEEPNGDFVNWVKQRSRWYKGYLQTWLVHLRRPVELWKALGPGGFAQFNLFVGGTPLLSLLNPFFWLLALVWFTGHASIIQQMFPAPLYHVALFCWIVGNLIVLYVTILGARRSDRNSLFWAACLVPAYWVMMSMAAIKAFWQVIAAPSFWEKTTHGLTIQGPTHDPVETAVPLASVIGVSHDAGLPPWAAAGAAREYRALPPGTNGGPNGQDDVASPAAWASPNGGRGNGAGLARPVMPPPAPTLVPPAPPLDSAPGAEVGTLPSRWVGFGRAVSVVGLLAALFIGYVVVVTGWQAHHSQHALGDTLAAVHAGAPHVGSPIARLVAPRVGIDSVVIEGTGRAQLNQGPGHVRRIGQPGWCRQRRHRRAPRRGRRSVRATGSHSPRGHDRAARPVGPGSLPRHHGLDTVGGVGRCREPGGAAPHAGHVGHEPRPGRTARRGRALDDCGQLLGAEARPRRTPTPGPRHDCTPPLLGGGGRGTPRLADATLARAGVGSAPRRVLRRTVRRARARRGLHRRAAPPSRHLLSSGRARTPAGAPRAPTTRRCQLTHEPANGREMSRMFGCRAGSFRSRSLGVHVRHLLCARSGKASRGGAGADLGRRRGHRRCAERAGGRGVGGRDRDGRRRADLRATRPAGRGGAAARALRPRTGSVRDAAQAQPRPGDGTQPQQRRGRRGSRLPMWRRRPRRRGHREPRARRPAPRAAPPRAASRPTRARRRPRRRAGGAQPGHASGHGAGTAWCRCRDASSTSSRC